MKETHISFVHHTSVRPNQTVIPPSIVEIENVLILVIVQKMLIALLVTTWVFVIASLVTLETHMGLHVHQFPYPQMIYVRKTKIVQAKKHALTDSMLIHVKQFNLVLKTLGVMSIVPCHLER